MRHSRILSSALRRTPLVAAYRAAASPQQHQHGDEAAAPTRGLRRLSVVRPDLVGEWVPDMNDLDVATVAITALDSVTWRCSTCAHQWAAPVRDRAIGEGGCPECARRAASGIASLNNGDSILTTHPSAAERWHTALNGSLRPSDVSATSTRAVWWRSADGKEAFRRPIYAFVREERSLREVHATEAEERMTALEHLAPLVGYSLPEGLRRAVDAFRGAAPNAEPLLSRSATGALTLAEVTAFEEQWCEEYNAAKSKANASKASSSTAATRAAAAALPTLSLDVSLANRGAYAPSVPIRALLDYHGEQLLTAVAEGKPGAHLPSYLLEREEAKAVYTLDEIVRARVNAHRIAANRLKFKVNRPFSSPLKSREMPEMPSPDSIIEAESGGKSTIAEEQGRSLPAAEFAPRSQRMRRVGFRRNQSLDMPDEIDESPVSLSARPDTDTPAEPAAAEPVVPEVVVPAAPRVVGRRRK